MYTYNTTLRMHHTDAAGILYFANQFRIAHEAFENFMASAGVELYKIITQAEYAIVIVHAEADYTAPLRVGDPLAVEVTAERIGDSSFTIAYRFVKEPGQPVGVAKTIHVAVDKKSWKKRPLPPEIRAAIGKLRVP